MYGRGEGILEPLFRAAVTEGKVAWYGRQGGKLPTVHQDDLADCEYSFLFVYFLLLTFIATVYVKAAEKSAIAAGQIFSAGNDMVEGVDTIMEKLAKVSGSKGYSWIEPSNGTCTPFTV